MATCSRQARRFDADALIRHADALHKDCHRAGTLFPPGSIDHHSRALPAIWDKPAAFEQELQRLHSATETLVAIAATGDKARLTASFEQVEDTCSGCHETFRLPDN